MASKSQKDAEKILTSIYYPKKNPGAPRGQVSQPVYLPGALSSTAKMSEALPQGVHGGASEVSRGIFGQGSNVLIPEASSTARVAMPKDAPTDSSVTTYHVVKEPSGGGESQILQMDTPPDAPQLSTSGPSEFPVASRPPIDPAVLASLIAASTPNPKTQWSMSNPWVVYPIMAAFIFIALMLLFRSA
jgi:hypothetical protein